MERKAEVCGIWLDNLSSDEILRTVKGFFGKGRLYVIDYIYADLLKQLVQDETLRAQVLESTDLTVLAEKSVAEVIEEPCELTEQEMKEQSVANRVLAYCVKHQKTVYWVGETERSYESFRAYADREYPQLRVVGAFATGAEVSEDVEDAIVNDMNRVAPDVILSKLSAPYQEQFVARQKMKINAQVWLGVSSRTNLTEPLPTSSKIKAMIDKTLLRRAVKKADNE